MISPDRDKLLNTFLDLVRLDSPSGHEGPVRDYLLQRLNALGLSAEVDAAGNLIVRVPAHRSTSGQTLAVTAHMDVVPPCIGVKPVVDGEGESRVIRSSGDTVLGADDKSALAPLLEALELSLKNDLPRPELLLLLTTREETMLQGAFEMDPAAYADADFAIAMDHTGQMGTLINEAPTYARFSMTVHGKSVHAGIMPEKGINAIKILSWVLENLTFGRLDDETTSNLGTITGGKAANIVPDRAVVHGEVRSHNTARLQAVLDNYARQLQQVVDPIEGASAAFEYDICFRHYRTDPDHPGLQRIERAMAQLGLPAERMRTNGGSDINVFAERGVPGAVLSAGYVRPHTVNETVSLADMDTLTRLLLALWEEFAA